MMELQSGRPYIKFYLDSLKDVLGLTNAAVRTLHAMLFFMDEDNIVDISPHRKEQIVDMIGLHKQSMFNGLNELKAVGIIEKVGIGLYFKVNATHIQRPRHDED